MSPRSFYGSVPSCLPARNDNRTAPDVTRLTLMAFGPGLLVAIVVTALFLARVW